MILVKNQINNDGEDRIKLINDPSVEPLDMVGGV